jgi:RNA polymerase-binding transcription factor DksA
MVTRQQIERLEQRVEGLIEQRARQHPRARLEQRILDQGVARCMKTGEEITEAELEARPCTGKMRIVHVIVFPPFRPGTGQAPAGKVA